MVGALNLILLFLCNFTATPIKAIVGYPQARSCYCGIRKIFGYEVSLCCTFILCTPPIGRICKNDTGQFFAIEERKLANSNDIFRYTETRQTITIVKCTRANTRYTFREHNLD